MTLPRPLAVLSLALLSRALPADGSDRTPGPLYPGDAGYETTVQVRFLGVAGFLIRRGPDVLLTAPLYSNPGIVSVVTDGPVYPNEERIARFHPDVEDVKAILVGHAHYDHLMDVPYVWERSPDAVIYGSSTTARILAGYDDQPSRDKRFPDHVPSIPSRKVRILDGKADTRNCHDLRTDVVDDRFRCPDLLPQRGDWERVPGAQARIRALCAQHPPQVGRHHQAPGCLSEDRATVPTRINDYREGPVFAYLIDFLGVDGRPVFRVYYQDVPANGSIGRVPDDLIVEREVDLALLCAGNWQQFPRTEKIVENLHPRHVLLGHWEDFFRPQDQAIREAPFQKIGGFERKLRRELDELPAGAARSLSRPQPGQLFVIPVSR